MLAVEEDDLGSRVVAYLLIFATAIVGSALIALGYGLIVRSERETVETIGAIAIGLGSATWGNLIGRWVQFLLNATQGGFVSFSVWHYIVMWSAQAFGIVGLVVGAFVAIKL